MSASPKDLKYYLEHPDDMPSDPKEIERLANEHMAAALEAGTAEMDVNAIVGQADETPGAAAAQEVKKEAKVDEAPAQEAVAVEAAPEGEAKPDGILAKDGKNVIPYSQLEMARQRASAAESLAKQQADEIAALKAAKATTELPVESEFLSPEELSALEVDSPTLAKTLRSQQAAIEKLTKTIQSVAQTQHEQAVNQEVEIKSEIQTAIDGNPTLATWQTAEDQTLWNEASKIDKMLRESPRYVNVSFADRFKKVVELTERAIELEPEVPETSSIALTPEQIMAAAKAKLASVQKAKRPVSLSDIPGGAPPAVDEKQKVEQSSVVALGQQFLGMTKDQLDAYLANL